MTDLHQALLSQSGRGRDATNPMQIPIHGWKDVLYRVYRGITEDRLLLTAAGVTYYMLLALVPSLTAFVSIYGLFNDRASVIDQVNLLVGLVPPGGLDLIREQLTRLTGESNDTLGVTLIISLVIAFWSASAGIKALFEAMNVAYHEREKRSFLALNVLALGFTLGGAVAAVLVVGTVLLMPPLLALLPFGEGLAWTVRIASYGVMLLVMSFSVAALYRWGPSRQTAKWRWITTGTVVAVLTVGITSVAFSWYVSNFNDYGAAYGSLGALIGLLTWMWISVTLVIVGAELNSEIEHQTARDSTTGDERPIGERGAHMADSIGRVWPPDRKRLASEYEAANRPQLSVGGAAFGLAALVVLGAAIRKR